MYNKIINSYTVLVFPHSNGHYCGYVRLPKGHKYYGISYEDIPIDVHGGLTSSCLEDDGTWEIGFDTNHKGDEDAGWTDEKVFEELKRVVKQLGNFYAFDF